MHDTNLRNTSGEGRQLQWIHSFHRFFCQLVVRVVYISPLKMPQNILAISVFLSQSKSKNLRNMTTDLHSRGNAQIHCLSPFFIPLNRRKTSLLSPLSFSSFCIIFRPQMCLYDGAFHHRRLPLIARAGSHGVRFREMF